MLSPLAQLVGIVVCLGLADVVGLIRFHYPRAVENDPLKSPVQVRSIDGDCLFLADGRELAVETFGDESLPQLLERVHFRVDVESSDGRQGELFIQERGWICGTPWVGVINIPLIPVSVPINHRRPIGYVAINRGHR